MTSKYYIRTFVENICYPQDMRINPEVIVDNF